MIASCFFLCSLLLSFLASCVFIVQCLLFIACCLFTDKIKLPLHYSVRVRDVCCLLVCLALLVRLAICLFIHFCFRDVQQPTDFCRIQCSSQCTTNNKQRAKTTATTNYNKAFLMAARLQLLVQVLSCLVLQAGSAI